MNPPFQLMGWDIETLKKDSLELPLWGDPNSMIKIMSYCINTFEKNMTTEWMAASYCLNNFDIDLFVEKNLAEIVADKVILISAKSEFELLKLHILFQFLPDYDYDNSYNGGLYDHRWVVERMLTYNIFEEYVRRLDNDRDTHRKSLVKLIEAYNEVPAIKISAEESHKVFWYPFKRFITLDTMPLMKRMHKKEEVGSGQSMNHYLGINKLPLKVDMDHGSMHNLFLVDYENPNGLSEIVDESNNIYIGNVVESEPVATFEKRKIDQNELREGLCKVVEYAIGDSICPNRLLTKKAIFTEAGQLSNLVYVNYEDGLLRADGMKITNFIWYMCKLHKHLISEKQSDEIQAKYEGTKEKYAGAYVVQPIKGLHKYIPDPGEQHPGDPGPCIHHKDLNTQTMNKYAKPVVPFDFQSLYPSIMMELNLCHSTKISDAILAQRLIAHGVKLNRHEYPEEAGMLYWTINHENNVEKYGIMPKTLRLLFSIRADELKPQLKVLKKISDKCEEAIPHILDEAVAAFPESFHAKFISDLKLKVKKETESAIKIIYKLISDLSGEIIDRLKKETEKLEDAIDKYKYYDAKQLAVKIMMNTVYGNLGYVFARICDFDLARTVTCVGRIALKAVIVFHRSQGHIVIYGDTDSTYIMFGHENYLDIFAIRLTLTRKEYCSRLVQRTFEIRAKYESHLKTFINSKFPRGLLKMAPEEIGFPFYQRGKKKYVTLTHESPNEIDFDATNIKHFLIKGLEMKQKGKTIVLSEMHYRIIKQFMDINDDTPEISVVEHCIDYLMNEYKWTLDDCAVYRTYKGEHVQNRSVNMLYHRIAINYPELKPAPYDKFKVAVVEKPMANMFGNKNQDMVKMGNRYELCEIIIKNSLRLDTIYYIVQQVGKSIASYIYYMDKFDTDLAGASPQRFEEIHMERESWSDLRWTKHNDKLKGAAQRYIEIYAKNKLSERDNKVSLLAAKRYFKSLAERYPLLKQIHKFKEYYNVDNIDDFKFIFASKSAITENPDDINDIIDPITESDIKFVDIEYDKITDPREKKKYLLKLLDICYNQVANVLPYAKEQIGILSDHIIENRDQHGMPLYISSEIRVDAIIRYNSLILTALKLVTAFNSLF
jgi:DNA polymerase elongation subunit (family B)